MSLIAPNSPMGTGAQQTGSLRQTQEVPKCFGTDYFGKWTMSGMTFDSMRIDRPEWQVKCAYCDLFERCYHCNHIRLLRIKK